MRCLAVSVAFLASLLAYAAEPNFTAVHTNAVLKWNAQMMNAIRRDNSAPTLSSRNLAILHCAIYDSVNSIVRTHQPYRFLSPHSTNASIEAAIHSCGRTVMNQLYPAMSAESDALFQEAKARLPDTLAVTNGMKIGRDAGSDLVMFRSSDGATRQFPYIPKTEPGQWRRTPPFFRPPLDPQWRYVRPFGIPEPERFVAPPPPSLDSPEYRDAFNEVKALGEKESCVRTVEQGEIAVFWSDFSYTAMPPGHWHEIAADILLEQPLTLPETARLFALLSIAQADAAIVCWETKYRYNTWRPVTAIRNAGADGNPETEADPKWNHYLNSPPFPEYTSGHSTFSKASATVLAHFFGTDKFSFAARSDSLPNKIRKFESFSSCADEVGMSRIYGGIHFQFGNAEGKRCGQMIGDYVSTNLLLALDGDPDRNKPVVPY